MNHFGKDIDDLLNLTDTDSSSSSNQGIFEQNQQFVLELHDIERDDPPNETVSTIETVNPETRVKKKKKKRTQPDADNSSYSSSLSGLSDVVPRATDTIGNDEFYDADESFHDLADDNNQTEVDALTTAALAQELSEHAQRIKTTPDGTTQTRLTSASSREPSSTISKPSVQP